jgi:hypothetical protein
LRTEAWWPALTAEFAQTEAALEAVLQAMVARGCLPAAQPPTAGPDASADADPQRWRAQLVRLRELLAAADMEAVELHEQLLANAAVAQDARWRALHEAMEAFDFEAAQAALQAMLDSAGVQA